MKRQELRLVEEASLTDMMIQEHIDNYFENQKLSYSVMCKKELKGHLISEDNWQRRHDLLSCEQLGVNIRIGDICFIDFGRAYCLESGFQHFGLLLTICHGKAFIIPMTSNEQTYAQGYHPVENPLGKKHLLQIGKVKGLHKPSVLFINDAKFINTARIIDVKAHIPIKSELYRIIEQSVKDCLGF